MNKDVWGQGGFLRRSLLILGDQNACKLRDYFPTLVFTALQGGGVLANKAALDLLGWEDLNAWFLLTEMWVSELFILHVLRFQRNVLSKVHSNPTRWTSAAFPKPAFQGIEASMTHSQESVL